MVELHNVDCLKILGGFEPDSIDACVTDPPYHLTAGKKGGTGDASVNPNSPAGRSMVSTGFMGQKWDGGDIAFRVETWAAISRVLKPGAFLLAFSGTRTYHRMTCAIEDAGFEIRDQLGWMYFSGFPKSLNLDGDRKGWGTALKPFWEPICLARKPLIGTVAANIAKYGTGALYIDGCRIALSDDDGLQDGTDGDYERLDTADQGWGFKRVPRAPGLGRWPANVLIGTDGSPEADAQVMAAFPQSDGAIAPVTGEEPSAPCDNGILGPRARVAGPFHGDVGGSASRFFFVAKASRSDRDAGCEMLKAAPRDVSRKEGNPGGDNPRNRGLDPRQNTHPTVKPTELMRYLCRLVTPPGGKIIDPFMGSGSTGRGAILEGFNFIGIEKEEAYMPIARARIREAEGELFSNIK